MKIKMTMKTTNITSFVLAAVLASATAVSSAQQVYRIVGADGKVTFSDKPPSEANAKVTAGAAAPTGGIVVSALPFELRQVASKYPVTLYTGDNCSPCALARAMLVTRGIPFAEKTVTTAEDSQALQRLSGDSSLPFATIGGQQLKGFSDSEWTQFLNAAGYPASSVLPASYRQGAATPLVALVAAPAGKAVAADNGGVNGSGPAAPARTLSRPVVPAPSTNPSGIRF